MKIFNTITLVLSLAILASCSQNEESVTDKKVPESKVLIDYQIPIQDIKNLQKLGFSGSPVQVLEKTIDGSEDKQIAYLLEGDIEISQESLPSMVGEESNSSARTEQYRTIPLVAIGWSSPRSGPPPAFRTITVTGVGIEDNNLRQGLIDAIENYNQLNLMLRFILNFIPERSRLSQSDIFVYLSDEGVRGSAGFPKNGNPYESVTVSRAIANLGLDICEHVFTHEIGHCIGLRHTDYFNRSLSCGGTSVDEGQGNGEAGGRGIPIVVGAVHIPGTPEQTNTDLNSVMVACFNGQNTGEFTDFDIIALRALY